MRKLHVFGLGERPLALLLKELLEGEGVACLIRNEELFAAMGEIPFIECFPELWVVDDEVYPRARVLLDGWLKRDEPKGEPWVCSGCGETLEGQFGACWNCGRERA
jgi:hypothetical protein